MVAFQSRLKKVIFTIVPASLLLIVFITDIIRGSVAIETRWMLILRDCIVIVAFILIYMLIELLWKRNQNPAKRLGFALVISLVVITATGLSSFLQPSGFEAKNFYLIPLSYDVIVLSNLYSIVLGVTMIVILLIFRDIIFLKPQAGTRRNFIILFILILGGMFSTLFFRPLESNIVRNILFVLSIVWVFINSFRLSWIVYLSKREKLYTMIYGLLLFLIFIGFTILTMDSMEIGKALLFYSPPLKGFINSTSAFGIVFFGMTFLSTLFHLPTAEAFDRKIIEVNSLHNLGRLVTQVLDFNDLVQTVTKMTLDVCKAQSSWLEILEDTPHLENKQNITVELTALQNVSSSDAQIIASSIGQVLREKIFQSSEPILIDDIETDERFRVNLNLKRWFRSMLVVPLLSHNKVIGILYATKDLPNGFDKDDINLITAFADQATIAIENSRLIKKSLERERLMREMLVAQEMQKKLLPQSLPQVEGLDIDALSTPAFEVGGDYYDFIQIDDHNLGIIVGDVSGKGVSAAFFMAEMKGIFQSLSRIYPSPKEFLTRAHEALAKTIDKKFFISVIYAVLNIETGELKHARAGHCPMLYISDSRGLYVKPVGLGLGMGDSQFFERTIVEEKFHLKQNDVVIFYTDGVIEARPPDDEEFGYDRLLELGVKVRNKTALEIRDSIVMAVDKHMKHHSPEDDLTVVVLKWKKST